MQNLGPALMALMLLVLVAFLAPNILALNRGKILRNIAIWLAIFLALALLYQNFGPGRSMTATQLWPFTSPRQDAPPPTPMAPVHDKSNFTPPKE